MYGYNPYKLGVFWCVGIDEKIEYLYIRNMFYLVLTGSKTHTSKFSENKEVR